MCFFESYITCTGNFGYFSIPFRIQLQEISLSKEGTVCCQLCCLTKSVARQNQATLRQCIKLCNLCTNVVSNSGQGNSFSVFLYQKWEGWIDKLIK